MKAMGKAAEAAGKAVAEAQRTQAEESKLSALEAQVTRDQKEAIRAARWGKAARFPIKDGRKAAAPSATGPAGKTARFQAQAQTAAQAELAKLQQDVKRKMSQVKQVQCARAAAGALAVARACCARPPCVAARPWFVLCMHVRTPSDRLWSCRQVQGFGAEGGCRRQHGGRAGHEEHQAGAWRGQQGQVQGQNAKQCAPLLISRMAGTGR